MNVAAACELGGSAAYSSTAHREHVAATAEAPDRSERRAESVEANEKPLLNGPHKPEAWLGLRGCHAVERDQ